MFEDVEVIKNSWKVVKITMWQEEDIGMLKLFDFIWFKFDIFKNYLE